MLMNDLCSKVVLPGIIFQLLIAVSDGKLNVTTTQPPLEAVVINGTRVEVTTVKIAEIASHHHSNATVLKAVTARHFTTSTPTARVILIPPANHTSQIKKHHHLK
jgi:hypothetical protein